jgi:hypothetical protein
VTAAVVRCLRYDAPGLPCQVPADGVIGIELYPFASLMKLRGLSTPLTRMILNMPLCGKHRGEAKVSELVDETVLAAAIRTVEQHSGVIVDPQSTKITCVAFDDPDYLMTERAMRQPSKVGPIIMRTITHHHDGHGLNESILITADDLGPGGASHHYEFVMNPSGNFSVFAGGLQFQKGARNVEGSTPGVTEAAVLAVLIDRLEGFQAGPYACAENDEQLEHLRAALALTKARADRRAAAGTLGTMQPDK